MLVLVDHHDVIMQLKECRSNAFNAYVPYVSEFRFENNFVYECKINYVFEFKYKFCILTQI